MSFEEYQSAWRESGSGTPIQGELDSLIQSVTKGERRRRILLAFCTLNTVAAFVFDAWYLMSGRAIAWTELLPVLALQVFLAFALAVLIRRRGQRQRALEMSGRSVLDAARTGLGHVRSEIRDIRWLALAAGVAVPVLAYVVNQLIRTGKMNGQEAWDFAIVCLIVIGANATYQTLRYRLTLKRRRERLEQIVGSLGGTA